jgi:hypothetical protein
MISTAGCQIRICLHTSAAVLLNRELAVILEPTLTD